jgi:hypothetical protein
MPGTVRLGVSALRHWLPKGAKRSGLGADGGLSRSNVPLRVTVCVIGVHRRTQKRYSQNVPKFAVQLMPLSSSATEYGDGEKLLKSDRATEILFDLTEGVL